MKAIGVDSKGNIKRFECIHGILRCYFEDLISLNIPEGIIYINCNNNLLDELNIPSSVRDLRCYDNLLTELTIPSSVKHLICDRNVKGLDNIDWDCEIKLF